MRTPRSSSVAAGVSRRTFLTATVGVAAAASAAAQAPAARPPLPEASSRDYSRLEPVPYPDADIVALDPRFRRYIIFNTSIRRLHLGTSWAEGPAWNVVGRYLVWSDIPANAQLRWIEDDSRVSTFRNPSGYSNGNTFDYEGRQLSCEHGGRRVARYERDGSVTTIAERFQGKRLNSPNDVVVHPDGSIWFTDPSFGIRGNYEGMRAESETKEAVYRVGKEGEIDKVTDEIGQPNGLCFSPDYRRLYVADSAGGDVKVWDVDGPRLRGGRRFSASGADGMRCDADGNVWAGARPGVQIIAPDGQVIGAIRLPEICANVCFGGQRRNRLFMTASQSLYAVYVGTNGAHIC
jgi:gluconolactonase